MRKSTSTTLVILAALGAALAAGPPNAAAADSELPVKACAEAVGTFLFTNRAADAKDGQGTSRSVIALTNGGHLIVVDSGEGGESAGSPFTSGLGRWRCLSQGDEAPRLSGTFLEFTLPKSGPQQIVRVDLQATYEPSSGSLRGTAVLYRLPLDGDPLDTEGLRDGQRFEVSGERIEP